MNGSMTGRPGAMLCRIILHRNSDSFQLFNCTSLLFALDDSIQFPPVNFAEPDGLLAMGGDLRPERLINAYRQGIFPWYENDPILWWCPDPRFILFPDDIYVSKSMQSEFKKGRFRFSTNEAFGAVIRNCKTTRR